METLMVRTGTQWSPPPPKFSDNTLVFFKIGCSEKSLQQHVKSLGGRWDAKKSVWTVPYGKIAGTNFEKFILSKTSG
jgi:hypothetical protein